MSQNVNLAEDVLAIDLVVEEACGVKPLVSSQYANEKLIFVKLTFNKPELLICDNKELENILSNFLFNKVGYSEMTGFYIERLIDDKYVMEQIR